MTKTTKTITTADKKAIVDMLVSNRPTARRWAVVRASSMKPVRAFATREAAREYKTTAKGNFKLWDNVNGIVVR